MYTVQWQVLHGCTVGVLQTQFASFWHKACFILLSHPALARCDIGVQFSVHPSFRPQFTSTLAF